MAKKAEKDEGEDLGQVLIRLPKLIRRAVKIVAHRNHRSVSNQIHAWVEECLPKDAIEEARNQLADD